MAKTMIGRILELITLAGFVAFSFIIVGGIQEIFGLKDLTPIGQIIVGLLGVIAISFLGKKYLGLDLQN